MVFYLVASAVAQVLLLPFFIQAVTDTFDGSFSSSRLAEVVLYTQGMCIALIHMILRTNAGLFAIKPKDTTNWDSKKKFRLFGPNDLEVHLDQRANERRRENPRQLAAKHEQGSTRAADGAGPPVPVPAEPLAIHQFPQVMAAE